MKSMGFFLFAAGLLGLYYAINMNTVVDSVFLGGVHNIGLLSEKQNFVIVSSVILISGLLLYLYDYKSDLTPEVRNKELEEKWNLMAQYDDVVRNEISRLEPYGTDAVNELKHIYFTLENKEILPDISVKILNKYKSQIEEKQLSEKLAEQKRNEELKASYSYIGNLAAEKIKDIKDIMSTIELGGQLTHSNEIEIINTAGGRFCWETAEFFAKPCRVVLPNFNKVFDSERSFRVWFYQEFLQAIRLILY